MQSEREKAAADRPAANPRQLFRLVATRLFLPLAAAAVLLTAFLCFYRLGSTACISWDEARHGVSAYEMLKSGDWLVNTYRGEPDYWNLKPPLSFWLIALCMKLLGPSVFSMRLYAALSFLLTAVAAGLFCLRRYGRLEALLGGLSVGCCALFHYLHFAHHGDPDALFTLLATVALLVMTTLRERPGRAFVCGLFFALAFLVKSWHSLLIAAVGGVYFLTGRLWRYLRPRHYAALAAAAGGPVLLWALLRWQRDGPRFFGEMVRYDLFARVAQPLENHSGSLLYYFRLIPKNTLLAGMLLLIAAFYLLAEHVTGEREVLGPSGDPGAVRLRGDLSAFAVWIIVPFLLFTAAQTKLSWYIFPAVVPMAMLAGVLAARILRRANVPALHKLLLAALIAVAFVFDIGQNLDTRRSFQPDDIQQFLTGELPDAQEAKPLRSRPVYLEVEAGPYSDLTGTQTEWTQNLVFLGEAYMDFDCRDGGADAMLAGDPNAVLIVDTQLFGSAWPDDLTPVYEGARFVCLTK